MSLQLPSGVAVRFFISRPGVSRDTSSIRFWNVKARFTGKHLLHFLRDEGILLPGNAAQVYVDELEGYTTLTENLRFDTRQHACVTVRITVTDSEEETPHHTAASATPAGMLAFGFMVMMQNMLPYVEREWAGKFACLALLYAGLVQFVVGLFELRRNNLFGGTTFTTYGAITLANGLYLILILTGTMEGGETKHGDLMEAMFKNLLAIILLFQTIKMNLAILSLVVTLIVFFFMDGFAAYDPSGSLAIITHAVGFVLGFVAIYLALAELTNEIHNRAVLPIGVFGSNTGAWTAPGRSVAVRHQVARLRDNQKPPEYSEIRDKEFANSS